MNGESGFDADGNRDVVVVFQKENRFEDFDVLGLDDGDFHRDRGHGRNAGATREAAIDMVFVVSNEGVGGEDFVREDTVEGRGPVWVCDEVGKRTAKTNAEGRRTACWDFKGDGLRVVAEDVKEAGLFNLEFDFLWGLWFFGHVGKRVRPMLVEKDGAHCHLNNSEHLLSPDWQAPLDAGWQEPEGGWSAGSTSPAREIYGPLAVFYLAHACKVSHKSDNTPI